jgi:hypothetical protein
MEIPSLEFKKTLFLKLNFEVSALMSGPETPEKPMVLFTFSWYAGSKNDKEEGGDSGRGLFFIKSFNCSIGRRCPVSM